MESAVGMQLRSKASPADSIIQSATLHRTEWAVPNAVSWDAAEPRWDGRRAGSRSVQMSLSPRQESLTFWGLWSLLLRVNCRASSMIRYKRGQLNHLSAARPTISEWCLMAWGISNSHCNPVHTLTRTCQYFKHHSNYVHDRAQPSWHHQNKKERKTTIVWSLQYQPRLLQIININIRLFHSFRGRIIDITKQWWE